MITARAVIPRREFIAPPDRLSVLIIQDCVRRSFCRGTCAFQMTLW